MKTCSVLLLFLVACGSVSAQAAVITLGADKDTSIYANNVNNSAGGGPGLFAGTNGASSPRRALISFDLSSIPAAATITDVQLTLTLGQVSGTPPDTVTIGLFDLVRSWGEGTTGSGATGIGGSGQGFAANPGDATWNAALFPGIAWTTAGGDHGSAASASLLVGTNPLNRAFTWLSTPQLVADMQGWLDNPSSNFGWELINANESMGNTVCGFYSSEWHTFSGGLTSQEPALQVTYSVPEPGCTALLTGAALLRASRRGLHAPAA